MTTANSMNCNSMNLKSKLPKSCQRLNSNIKQFKSLAVFRALELNLEKLGLERRSISDRKFWTKVYKTQIQILIKPYMRKMTNKYNDQKLKNSLQHLVFRLSFMRIVIWTKNMSSLDLKICLSCKKEESVKCCD